MNGKIKQLIRAENAYAVYTDRDNDEPFFVPIALWALVEDLNGSQRIVGVCLEDIAEQKFADEVSLEQGLAFLGYSAEDEIEGPLWQEKALNYWAKEFKA